MIHQSSLELVGGTPLLQLNNWMRLHGLKVNVIAKIEALNPHRSGRRHHRAHLGQHGHRAREHCRRPRLSRHLHDA